MLINKIVVKFIPNFTRAINNFNTYHLLAHVGGKPQIFAKVNTGSSLHVCGWSDIKPQHKHFGAPSGLDCSKVASFSLY